MEGSCPRLSLGSCTWLLESSDPSPPESGMSLLLLLVPQDGLLGTRCSGPGGLSPLLPSRHLPSPHCHLAAVLSGHRALSAPCAVSVPRSGLPGRGFQVLLREDFGQEGLSNAVPLPARRGWRALEAAARCLPGSPPAPVGAVWRVCRRRGRGARSPGTPPGPQCWPGRRGGCLVTCKDGDCT